MEMVSRQGLYRPTVEDGVELSGMEILHPGGIQLTRRSAEVARLGPGTKVLDVSSGRGTNAILYYQEFGAEVVGIDISPGMVEAARHRAALAGASNRICFHLGDSQQLPFEDNHFDAVINECAVGIPQYPARVLSEMARVVKPGGTVVIHESTWRKPIGVSRKAEIAERYGTTPLAQDEWLWLMEQAGLEGLQSELEPWSRPESFYQVRKDREVSNFQSILSSGERFRMMRKIFTHFGLSGLWNAHRNERKFIKTVTQGELGYGLYWGIKAPAEGASVRSGSDVAAC